MCLNLGAFLGLSQAKEKRKRWTESFCQPEDLLLVRPLETKVQGDAAAQQVRRDTQKCGWERGMLLGAGRGEQCPVLAGMLRTRPLLPSDSCRQSQCCSRTLQLSPGHVVTSSCWFVAQEKVTPCLDRSPDGCMRMGGRTGDCFPPLFPSTDVSAPVLEDV